MSEELPLRVSDIQLPGSAEDLLALAKYIIDKHQQLSPGSPLKTHLIADLNYKTALAKAKHDEGMKYMKLMESAFAERNILTGHGSDDPKGMLTIKGLLTMASTLLFEINPSLLREWGFQMKESITE